MSRFITLTTVQTESGSTYVIEDDPALDQRRVRLALPGEAHGDRHPISTDAFREAEIVRLPSGGLLIAFANGERVYTSPVKIEQKAEVCAR